ncbi:MAG TPA: rhodanese-like domain-containing protein, partial [Candidatus Binataceae bacterium]|nr:rhodanese-like domain-containing protein [Candidatus Binataceae bacterium]
DAPYALLDVREWGEFELGQILGSRSLPRGSLEIYLPYLVPKKPGVTVVFLCNDGVRSQRAAATAEALGYDRVAVLDGGLDAWKKSGGEIYGGWALTGKDYGEKLLVEDAIPEMSAAELHRRLAAGERVCVLDSRPSAEYRAAHLPGARSAPIGQLALEAGGLIDDSNVPVVTNCAGRTRSIIAAHLLRRMKLANSVFALKGGTGAWRIAGWGTELANGDDLPHPPAAASARASADQFAARVAHEDHLGSLSPSQLDALSNSDELLYILDVRQPHEFVAGHIPGARFCSGTQVQFAVDALVGVPNARVVTVCDGRVRATVAASILKGMGYPRVAVLDGGVTAWKSAGYQLDSGVPDELDYGEPPWLARFLQDFPSSLGVPRPLPVPGLNDARSLSHLISADQLQQRLQRNLEQVVIDTRGAGEFVTAHVPGAKWLSRGWIDLKIRELAPDLNATLVLYCRRAVESVLAAATLSRIGYRDVAVLDGGFDAWKARGLAVEEGLGSQGELEEVAFAEVGLFGAGKFGYSNERMARYLKDEEALGRRHRPAANP